jgi:hypothetical protein
MLHKLSCYNTIFETNKYNPPTHLTTRINNEETINHQHQITHRL